MKNIQHPVNQQILVYSLLVNLSLLLSQKNNAPLTTNRKSKPNSENSTRKRERVLIIDDGVRFRKAMRFLLEDKYVVKVDIAASGDEAIRRLKELSSYDLIFLDIKMNGMDGIETYHHIRKMGVDCEIVIMSAYADSKQWKKAEALNVTLVRKPFPENKLDDIMKGLKGVDNG